MDFSKIKVPMVLVVGALGVAAGSGGTIAAASAKQAHTEERVLANEKQIAELKQATEADRQRAIRTETILERIDKNVERLEKKVDQLR
jgi:uncharacterized FlaG/YvyC family protein